MYRYLILIFLLFSANKCEQVKPGSPEITEGELKQHVSVFAADELAGRYPGTVGDSLAATYIQAQFKAHGLELPFDKGIQFFQVVPRVIAGPANELLFGTWTGRQGKDFSPYSFSGSETLSAPLVYAAYGLQLKNDSLTLNDYEGLELKGKWCMILEGVPEKHISPPSDREKIMLAKDQGAAGVLLVVESADRVKTMSQDQIRQEGSLGIPSFFISSEAADQLLLASGTSLMKLKAAYPVTGHQKGMELNGMLKGTAEIRPVSVRTRNICGILRSSDPQFGSEYLVIGAHYDHLGMGGPGTSSRTPDTVAVHNGADDNASGVSLMLELAEKFASERNTLKRSILFAAFGAEEMGILGSKYLTSNLPIPAEKISAMINLDMVGRLRDDQSLQVAGAGTSAEAPELLARANPDSSLKLIPTPEGMGPSDYASFYGKNIPVFGITTGAHMDYHTPYDDADRINYAGMKKVGDFSFRLAQSIISEPLKLSFRESGPKEQAGQGRTRMKVTLGIMPDFTSTDNQGLRVDFVTKDKPAFKGGMLKGDVIKSINNMPVQNVQEYMYRMSKLSAGDSIVVEVLRNGKKELLIIQL